MATHSSVLAWRIPGVGEPGGLPSMGSHRAGHDRSNLAAAAFPLIQINLPEIKLLVHHSLVQIVNRSLLLIELILGLCNSQQYFLKLPLTWSFATSLHYFYTSIK